MRPFASIILLVVMSAFASGLLQWLHLREHQREDAREAAFLALNHDASSSPPVPHEHEHSEENCPLCAQFHAPITSTFWLTILFDSGQWLRFVSMLPVSQQSQTFPARISCRGPPAA